MAIISFSGQQNMIESSYMKYLININQSLLQFICFCVLYFCYFLDYPGVPFASLIIENLRLDILVNLSFLAFNEGG